MPKIIPNLRESILNSTRRHLTESGPGGLTIAAVAADCGVAIGTIYNYYESKEMLIVSVIADDWTKVLTDIHALCDSAPAVFEGLSAIQSHLYTFFCSYVEVFQPESSPSPRFAFPKLHLALRDQIASCVALLRSRFSGDEDSLLDSFIADSLIAWATEESGFEMLRPIYDRLLKTSEKE